MEVLSFSRGDGVIVELKLSIISKSFLTQVAANDIKTNVTRFDHTCNSEAFVQ